MGPTSFNVVAALIAGESGATQSTTALTVALISLLGAVGVGVLSAISSAHLQRRNADLEERIAERSREADERLKHLEHTNNLTLRQLEASERDRAAAASRAAVARRYREPLLIAAIELYGRLRNIVGKDFLGAFLQDGRPHEKRYAETHTFYQVAQYFCWVEIIRREVQFLAPDDEAHERELAGRLQAVNDAFSSDHLTRVIQERVKSFPYPLDALLSRIREDVRLDAEPTFRLFRGEQRAIGELLVVPLAQPGHGIPSWGCMGYAQFTTALESESTGIWFASLSQDLQALSGQLYERGARIVVIQAALVDLINELDPDGTRSPYNRREVEGLVKARKVVGRA